MLASAPDAAFADLGTITLTLLATIFGTVRNVFERNLTEDEARPVRSQLLVMCKAYLEVIGLHSSPGRSSELLLLSSVDAGQMASSS